MISSRIQLPAKSLESDLMFGNSRFGAGSFFVNANFLDLIDIAADDSRFKILRLSRNYRMDGGLTAGLDFINGDACFLMTADLQDPPELIHPFLRKWEEGYENIYGIVEDRQGINPLRRFNSKLFYKFAKLLTNGKIPENVSDFRLVDKKVYLAVREMKERNRC